MRLCRLLSPSHTGWMQRMHCWQVSSPSLTLTPRGSLQKISQHSCFLEKIWRKSMLRYEEHLNTKLLSNQGAFLLWSSTVWPTYFLTSCIVSFCWGTHFMTKHQSQDKWTQISCSASELMMLPSSVSTYCAHNLAEHSQNSQKERVSWKWTAGLRGRPLLSMHWHLVFSAEQSFHSPPSSLRKNVCQELAVSFNGLLSFCAAEESWCLKASLMLVVTLCGFLKVYSCKLLS